MRVEFTNHGAPTGGSSSLSLSLPAGLAPLPDSVTLNGSVVGTSVVDGTLRVPVGALAAGATGVVTARLMLADSATGHDLTFSALMLDGAVTEPVGTTSVPIVGVTLDVASKTGSLTLPASGKAPAGSVVTIVDGETLVGQTTATPAGYWFATLTLPDRGQGHWFTLRAQTTPDTTTLHSDPAHVQYDKFLPAVETITVSQPDGRVMDFAGEGAVARFPYVFTPLQPVTVAVKFADPLRVKNVVLHIGDRSAPASLAGGTYSAPLAGGYGAIFLDYDVAPTTAPLSDQSPRQELEALHDQLPGAFAAFGTPVIDPATTEGDATTQSVLVPLSGAGTSVSASMTIEPNVLYIPTAQDLSGAASTGTTVYGMSVSDPVVSDGNTVVTGSAYIPMSELGAVTDSDSLAPASSGLRLHPAIAGEQLVARVGFKVAFDGVTNLDSLISSATEGGKWDKMNQLLDQIGTCGGGESSRAPIYTDALNSIANRAISYDAVNAGLTIAGAALAPETFGLGTIAVWAIGYGLGKAMDYQIDNMLADLGQQISGDPDCQKEDDDNFDDHRRKKLADPVWIFDPSGFAYVGVAGDRLEGVTATLVRSDSEAGPYAMWDADWFGQANPLITDPQGRYAWDVPDGWYKVVFSKDGYLTASSDPVQVLPPHFDINVGLVPLARPSVTGSTIGSGGVIEATFSTWMRASLLSGSQVQVTTADGTRVDGAVTPVGVETTPDGVEVAKSVRFTPSVPLPAGTSVRLSIAAGMLDFAGRSMEAASSKDLAAPAAPPSGGGGGAPAGGTVTVSAPTAAGGTTSASVSTMAGNVTATFAGVTAGGQFSVAPTSAGVDGFVVAGQAFQLSATMPFSSALVCLPYHPSGLRGLGIGVGEVSIFHVDKDGLAHDITTSRDLVAGVVCGTTSSFSAFFVGVARSARLAGADRIGTAIAVSKATFAPGVPVAYVATAADFPDALAVGPLAATAGGPVLLTSGASLPEAVRAELIRLKPAKIVVVGGTAVIPDAVSQALAKIAPASRLAGADRYATAAAVSKAAFPSSVVTVYVARGDAFPDALAAGPAVARDHADLLIVPASGVPQSIADELARLRPSRIVILGGPAAVPDATVTALAKLSGGTTSRLAGPDRYATAAAVAATFGAGLPAMVVSGARFPDALAAAAVAGRYGGPVLLTAPDSLPAATAAALKRLAASRVVVVGGPAAISAAVQAAAADAR